MASRAKTSAKAKPAKTPAARKPAGVPAKGPRAKAAIKPPACPTTDYARKVAGGDILAGRLVRLACERHLHDLDTGRLRGLTFDRDAADRVFRFFSLLRLPADGEIDGIPFTLQPAQQFFIGSIFGWKRADGYRRFRTAYIETAKGSGKSPVAGGIGLYGLVADGEAAAEIYSAATTASQAAILFRDAKRMVESSPALRDALDLGAHNIAYLPTDSFFRPVSAEHRQLSGPRPHMSLIDEIHEHPTAVVVDKLRAGTKGRRQALQFEITNSGHDRTSVCWAHHEYSEKVLEGVVNNDAWFAYVCQLDPCESCRAEGQRQPVDGCADCDDWRDERVWPKANPLLGVTIQPSYLREQVEEAKGMPTKEGIVKRLNFCLWTEGSTRAIPMDKWDALAAAEFDIKTFKGRQCYAGLDIGATSDFTAFVLLFPHDDTEDVELPGGEGKPPERITRRSYTLVPYFWLPESPVRRDERTQEVLDGWRRQGFIRTTPGDVVDYRRVAKDIEALGEEFDIRECAFDRGFQGAQIGTDLIDMFGTSWLFSMPQGLLSMAQPFREFLELIRTGRLHNNGDPVMRWMAANCAAETRNGLSKPSKDHSSEKIDGVVAAVMALARAMAAPDTPPMIIF